MANVKTVATLPTAEQYIAEYMASKLNGVKAPKRSIMDRLAQFVEDKAIDTVADSKRIGGRVSAAWAAAEDGYNEAQVLEHKRQAERAARRLGLV